MAEVGLSPQIDSCEYVLLQSISETDEDHLTIVIREAVTLSEEETKLRGPAQPLQGASLIAADEHSRTFKLVWTSYISYVVHNESYSMRTPIDRIKSGRYLRVYETSAFLEYVEKATFASIDYPGPFTHVEVACLSHIIDVVSTELPIISMSSGKPLLRSVPD
jgi:hypothetical protein